MRPDLDEKLCRDFPILYADRRGDLRSTCMCWGFDCGDGWYDLIYDLSSRLEQLIRREPKWRLSWSIACGLRNWHFGTHKSRDFISVYLGPLAVFATSRRIFRASQVKEKYGTLCFYTFCETDEMFDEIREAERKSAHVCEKCGAVGEMRRVRGWYEVRCADC